MPTVLAPADYLISARRLMEYRGMFRLTEDELRAGPVLDCPGGAASFGAEVRRLGGEVMSVDPIYAKPIAEVVDRAFDAVEKTSATSAEHPHMFSWTFFRSVEHHRQMRTDACREFVRDITDPSERASRYLAASLPDLPFDDGSFSLTLSSHLLFTYDHLLDADAAIAAISELVRVTAREGEVRLFPLVSASGGKSAHVDPVRDALGARGLETRVERVWYEAQRGGNELLRIRRR